MAEPQPVITVLFDEAHSQAWSIRPDVTRRMQPTHPGDASYVNAARALRARRMAVEPHAAGALSDAVLDDVDVVVIAHPSDARWEATTESGSAVFGPHELDALEQFVEGGGGLVVLGETEQEKYGTNLNVLLARFGIEVEHSAIQDYERHHSGSPSWVLGDLAEGQRGAAGDVLAGVDAVCFYRSGHLAVSAPHVRVLARTSASATIAGAPLIATAEHGAGRVVVFADSDLFGDDCIGELGHEALWRNVVSWAAGARYARSASGRTSGAEQKMAWRELRDATDALRLLQAADGSVSDRRAAQAHVEAMTGAIEQLIPHFTHQREYLTAVISDLEAWIANGGNRPDFGASLDVFRPEQQRADGVEHLVVFPMYLQNASRDTRFEALIVRVPWPDWLAALEQTRYDNPKFVPVTLVDHTAGYHSECAVLFPETVAVAGQPANHFGGIFCDREAERFRRVIGSAVEILGVNVPPDAVALLQSEQLSQEAYMLWDLIHDRAHSRGDLPFDPFMIRQRMPFWMYSLEELRCDLTAFCEAVTLEQEGNAAARDVQYAILFDRAFRFPLTGPRVRNYDGLGGQLLFAYLHRAGVLRWTDNRLTIDWDGLAGAVAALRSEVEDLYRAGIDRSRLAQWSAAHDLVARYVPPTSISRWRDGVREFAEAEDLRPHIDQVDPDEFPLSMFFSSLKPKVEPVLARPGRAPSVAAVAG